MGLGSLRQPMFIKLGFHGDWEREPLMPACPKGWPPGPGQAFLARRSDPRVKSHILVKIRFADFLKEMLQGKGGQGPLVRKKPSET